MLLFKLDTFKWVNVKLKFLIQAQAENQELPKYHLSKAGTLKPDIKYNPTDS